MNVNFFLTFLLTINLCVNAQEQIPLISVDKITFYSDILKEERTIKVHLPKEYKVCNERYSVLYVFDSPENFIPVIGLVDHLISSYQSIPNMIVVGIENTYRNRDMNNRKIADFRFTEDGGADNYIKHLTNELIPKIDSTYRTQDFRLIYGHSSSASFAAYFMAKKSDLIDVCFAVDPAFWVDTTMLTDFLQVVSNSNLTDNYFYFSHSRAGDIRMISSNFTLFKDLEIKYSDKLHWNFQYYQDEDHYSIRLRSLYDGLENYFSDCKIPYKYLWYNDANQLAEHIKNANKKYKITPLYSENLVNGYAKSFIRSNDLDGALELLSLNKEYYPESYKINSLIGQVYEKKGDKKNAVKYFKESLLLKADTDLENRIEQLENK
jgi:predicted alpha/beta superfamily hydrolase